MLEAKILYMGVSRQSLHSQSLYSACYIDCPVTKSKQAHHRYHGGSALELHLSITLQELLRPNITNLMKREMC